MSITYPTQPAVENSPEHASEKRLLLISYHFPPVGGAGVQRPLKFVKYLPEYGWMPTVLTAENPSAPVFDDSLCRDFPTGLRIERARTWEPDYQLKSSLQQQAAAKQRLSLKSWLARSVKSTAKLLLQPDPQILWLPNAYRRAVQVLRNTPHHALIATAPTYTNLILGAMLKKRFGIPLLLDYRDEWDLSSKYLENRSQDWYSNFVQSRQQAYVLRQADALIATTQLSTDTLYRRALALGRDLPSLCIYNGYDAEDFEHLKTPAPRNDRFKLVYTGTLWRLTNIEPLVRAIEKLQVQYPRIVEKLEFHCVGRKLPEQQLFLDRLQRTACRLVTADYSPHEQVVELMHSANALCLLLTDLPGAERVAPGKLFEYLASQKPVLSILPEGETSRLVNRFHPDSRFTPRDIDGIADWLHQAIRNHLAGDAPPAPRNADEIGQFSRVGQTGSLADLLNQVTHNSAAASVVNIG
ncbi:MAG: hypothetical protein U0903_06200 [Planctomycetales bacterium]